MMYVMEEQLIKKLRKGDEKAFRLLYDRHYVLLCRFANQILNNAALAEEVVDDVIFIYGNIGVKLRFVILSVLI